MGELESIVQRMIDAGEPEANIALVIREFNQPDPAKIQQAVDAAKGARENEKRIYAENKPTARQLVGSFMRGAGEGAVKNLPAIAGMAAMPVTGGMSVIPGALTMAGAMGGGSLLRSALDDKDETLSGALKTAGGEATVGALTEGVGRGAGRVIQGAGRMIARLPVMATVRPSAAVRREFGGAKKIADTILDEGLMTSGGANQAMRDSRAAALRMARGARHTTAPIQPSELLDDVMPVVRRGETRAAMGMADTTTDDIVSQLARMEKANPGGIRVDKGQVFKEEAQGLSSGAYKSRALGNDVNSLSAETNEAVAKGLRKAIEDRVPAIGPTNARTQRLVGSRKAIKEAEERPHALTNMLSILSAGGGLVSGNPEPGVAGALAIRALSSPKSGMALGHLINQGSRTIGNPNTIKAAVLAALLGQSE